MASEIHALVHGFDSAYITKHLIEEVMGTKLEIDRYVDSKTLIDVVSKSAATSEKRVQIDDQSLRECQENGELRTLSHIPGIQNYADDLTKNKVSKKHCLLILMRTNKIDIKVECWATNTMKLVKY